MEQPATEAGAELFPASRPDSPVRHLPAGPILICDSAGSLFTKSYIIKSRADELGRQVTEHPMNDDDRIRQEERRRSEEERRTRAEENQRRRDDDARRRSEDENRRRRADEDRLRR